MKHFHKGCNYSNDANENEVMVFWAINPGDKVNPWSNHRATIVARWSNNNTILVKPATPAFNAQNIIGYLSIKFFYYLNVC